MRVAVTLSLATMPIAAGAASRGSIILYGASWCAPCQSEIRGAAALAAAASPEQIVIVWDDAPALRRRLAAVANVRVAGDAEATRLIGLIDRQWQAGLPYALMRDARGRRCAVWHGALGARDVPRLRAACRA